jgi:hypothetical protein
MTTKYAPPPADLHERIRNAKAKAKVASKHVKSGITTAERVKAAVAAATLRAQQIK